LCRVVILASTYFPVDINSILHRLGSAGKRDGEVMVDQRPFARREEARM